MKKSKKQRINKSKASSYNGTKSQKKQRDEIYKLPPSLEGAFAVIVAQNALLLSKPITDIAIHCKIQFIDILVVSFALVNCFIVITNWAACKVFYYSNAVLFCNDIITLTLMATVTNIISGMFTDTQNIFNEKTFYLLIGIYYILIHTLYIWWNYIVCKGLKREETGVFRKQNIQNTVSILIALILLITTSFTFYILISRIIYGLSVLFWFYMLVSFVRTFNVPMQ